MKQLEVTWVIERNNKNHTESKMFLYYTALN